LKWLGLQDVGPVQHAFLEKNPTDLYETLKVAALRYSVHDIVNACHMILEGNFDSNKVRPLVENLLSLKFEKSVNGESKINTGVDRTEKLILQNQGEFEGTAWNMFNNEGAAVECLTCRDDPSVYVLIDKESKVYKFEIEQKSYKLSITQKWSV